MSQSNSFDPDPMLDQIVTALREEPIPDFHDSLAAHPAVDAGNEDRVPDPLGAAGVRKRTRLRRIMIGATGIAAAAALVVMFLANGPAGVTNLAFAQIQEAVSNTKSLRCRFLDFHGEQDPYVTTTISAFGLGSRAEGSDSSVSVTNLKARRSIRIDHRNRTAQISQLYLERGDERDGDVFMEKIRNLPASGAKERGSTVFNGKKVLRFAFALDGNFVVFVDPATRLPVRMEMTLEKGLPGGKPFREVVTDFVFDAPVEESLLEIKAPPGYAVSYCEEPKDRRPVDTRTIIACPAKGFGPVRLGSSKAQVIAAFGTPDLIKETFRGPRLYRSPGGPPISGQKDTVAEQLEYPSLGFAIGVSSDEGVTGFECFGRLHMGNMARDFQGRTDARIGLGASMDDVLNAYGKPDVRTHLRDDALFYFHKGWNFIFDDGKLVSFSISKPRGEEIDIHDNGDGTWTERIKEKKTP